MKRLSLNAWNDWRWVTRSIVEVTLLRCSFDYLRGHYASADFVLLGLGFSLTYYANPEAAEREAHDHDGWGGEPQGMEKLP